MTGQKIQTFQERFTMLVSESEKTLTQLSKDLHMSNQTLSAWRNGTRSPKAPTVIAIAEYFNVDVRWLMGFDVERGSKKGQRKVVVPDSDLFRKLIFAMTPSDYETMMQILERTERKLKERGEL